MKNILIDTSVILDGLENVTMIAKHDNVFITDVVLRELDGNKGAEGSKGYNAREFFRQLNRHGFKKLDALPLTGKTLEKNDTLTEGSIDSGAHVYTLSRKWYRAKDINDSKIIEMAKDYELTLQTFDQAQCARAKSQGINGEIFKKPNVGSSRVSEMAKKALIAIYVGSFTLVFAMLLSVNYEIDPFTLPVLLLWGVGAYLLYKFETRWSGKTGSGGSWGDDEHGWSRKNNSSPEYYNSDSFKFDHMHKM